MENNSGNQNPQNTEEEDLDSLNKVEIQEGETDTEKIAKLTEANKKLFARAKKAEEEAKTLKNKPQEEKPKEEPKPVQQPTSEDLIRKIAREEADERDLASMDLSDELKSQVKSYAKVNKVSYRDAVNSKYIGFLKQEEAEKIKVEEASATSKGVSIKAKRDFANLSNEDIKNLSDEEYKEYNRWLKSQE